MTQWHSYWPAAWLPRPRGTRTRHTRAGCGWPTTERSPPVTKTGQPEPNGFGTADRVDLGSSVIYPGLIDLHSHLGYNTMPLWADPGQTKPYLHHDSWPGEPTYKSELSWPAWTLAEFAPESLLAYVQVRALAGGTTSIQGWPNSSRSASNVLVRNVDDDQVSPLRDPVRVSALTMKSADLRVRATNLRDGRIFIYHCAEGQPGSTVTREFDELDATGCLQRGLVATHTCALDSTHYQRWRAAVAPPAGSTAGTVVWSPFSNLWLYGMTTDVPAARASGLEICLGTDWGPSGTRNLLGELKVARNHSDINGWNLTDHDLVRMVTSAPGDALTRAWKAPIGRLEPGALADVVVLDSRTDDPWANLVGARERDIQLVVVGGKPRWGTTALMSAAGVRSSMTTSVPMGTVRTLVTLARWSARTIRVGPGPGPMYVLGSSPYEPAPQRDPPPAGHAGRACGQCWPAPQGPDRADPTDRADPSQPDLAPDDQGPRVPRWCPGRPGRCVPMTAAKTSAKSTSAKSTSAKATRAKATRAKATRAAAIRKAQHGTLLSNYFPPGKRPRRDRVPEVPVEVRDQVIETFRGLIEGLYTHLPLKRSMYGADPVQRLRLLQQRAERLDDLGFHHELASIVTGLRDAHTRYLGPATLAGRAAMLPFLVESYGPVTKARYIVSKVAEDGALIGDRRFVPGVELRWRSWMRTPIRPATCSRPGSSTTRSVRW